MAWADKHVPHEESMVSTSADDSNVYPIALVPSCETVDDVNAITGVEVVNGTLTVNSPDLKRRFVSIGTATDQIKLASKLGGISRTKQKQGIGCRIHPMKFQGTSGDPTPWITAAQCKTRKRKESQNK
jgi:hypothetical protein